MSIALERPAAARPTPAAANLPSAAQLAMELLGGVRVLRRQVASNTDAHELVSRGIPAEAMTRLFATISTISLDRLCEAVGVSARSFARRKAAPRALLPAGESERLWRFAEIFAHATRVFGSQIEAEQWLTRAVTALDRRRPLDLLSTHPGARLVSDYLTRIEHGVYA